MNIDSKQFFADLETLNQFGRQPNGAIHRVAYSPADSQAREWLHGRLHDLNLTPHTDSAGNTTARYPGLNPDLPPIAIGSHTDTVPYGGAYDGALGVIAALAVLESLHESSTQLQHPIELINFAAEEATMAGGTTGSQAMTGIFNPAILDKRAWDGRPVRQHLTEAGLDPDQLNQAQRPAGSFAAFLELHIEQSDRLIQANKQIAIVDGFVGIRRYGVTFQGNANHAGTTPMNRRQDALLMAAPLISFVNTVAIELGIVGTIGDFNVYPGAPNVIPERVEMIVEIRGLSAAVLDQAETIISNETDKLGGRFNPVVTKPPVQADQIIQQALHTACDTLNLTTLVMPSGAGHDAMNMSLLCPQGIFFVPSQNGISHSKDEFTTAEDCLNGAQLYLEAVIQLDQLLTTQPI